MTGETQFQTKSLYVHIPFCVKKCAYCDFLSFEEKNFTEYVSALIKEIKSSGINENIDTVYIGGGTPTALPPFLLCEILQAVQYFPLLPDAEVTVEANPGTLNPAYLWDLKKHGVNRLSMGLQTTQKNLLGALGRIHTFGAFEENFHAAREAGFTNINVDLMFALPGQEMKHWHETLYQVIALAPAHISAYSLTPAENTPLWGKIKSGEIILPREETDRAMYHDARRILAEAGYAQYEISNFALPGYESRHNMNCWTMRPYIGFGLGAHSFDGKTRWQNAENFADYFRGEKIILSALSESDLIAETIILGLRLTQGIIVNHATIYKNEIDKLIKDGLLSRSADRLFLTPRGMDLANRVFCEFIPTIP